MGVLAQAKNGDKHFWNIEISCCQWEGSACTQSALFIFSFMYWVRGGEGRGRIFFPFLICSQHVPFQGPNGFPSGSQWVHQGCSQQHLPYVLPKVLPFSPIQVGQRGRHFIFPQNLLFWGASIVSTFFCNGPIKLAHCKQK